MSKHWIQDAVKHPGALHKELEVKQGEKIPEEKIEKAAHAPGKLGQRARFAENMKKMRSVDDLREHFKKHFSK